jgi:iron transport multicopper oxidase
MCDGLRGAFILYDPNDPYRSLYDIDNGIVLNCILRTALNLVSFRVNHHYTSGLVGATYTSVSGEYLRLRRFHVPARNALPKIPTSQATLINGKGRYPNGPAVPLSVVNVVEGKRYRFRLIAMSCEPNFEFSIDGHNLTIIEADGENTHPLLVDSLQIFSGQRYSVVFVANQPVGNYWMRANPDARGLPGFDGGRNSAILRYAGAPIADPTTTQTPNVRPLKETDLSPLTNPAAPGNSVVGGADVVLSINSAYDANAIAFDINGVSFKPPTAPVLLQILSGAKSAQELLPAGSLYALPPNKVIEINIPGLDYPAGGPVSSRLFF